MMRVRLLPEPGGDWIVEVDRSRAEVLLNCVPLGLTDVQDKSVRAQIADVGAAVLAHLAAHPAASDEVLATVALSAIVTV